ncbi:MAG: glycosyltransferase family 4 protein [Deltaproteobacteria bacterium]|nr:glycosyltransferase family 4 protein [Deltaproteobacteria bacterium]
MIRPLMINFADNQGGAAKACLRLYRALRQRGVGVSMVVSRKRSSLEGVLGPGNIWGRFRALAGPTLERLVFQHRLINRKGMFSVNALPDNLPQALKAAPEHNLIHLHWINGAFVRIETLSRFRGPVVWTLHDLWPFSGGCHYPGECTRYTGQCGRCPMLGSRFMDDLSAKTWRRKSRAWQGLNLVLIAPSRWIGNEARKSSLFKEKRIEVIPNGVDLARFRPREKEALRKNLNLSGRKKLILTTHADDDRGDRKGIGILAEALRKLKNSGYGTDVELVVVGTGSLDSPQRFGVKTVCAGRIHGESSMAEYYAAVDLFVAPSREDNLPNTVLEAMACGTPCVAFNVGGLPDMVEHEKNGYLARPFDPGDLAKGIASIFADEKFRGMLSIYARRKAEMEFGIETCADRHISLYEDLVDGVG